METLIILIIIILLGGFAVTTAKNVYDNFLSSLKLYHTYYSNIPMAVVMATIEIESSWQPDAVEKSGTSIVSVGLAQINPWAWGVYLNLTAGNQVNELLNPDKNILCCYKVWNYFVLKFPSYSFAELTQIYNLGETKYNKGYRNPAYQSKWEIAFNKYKGVV